MFDYGALLENWSDMSNTNNNYIICTMKTVLTILLDFIDKNPTAFVVVRVNTEIKRLLYNRIFKNYYKEYASILLVLTDDKTEKVEATFDKTHEIFYICKNSNVWYRNHI